MKTLTIYTVFVFSLVFIGSFKGVNDDTSKLYIMALKEHILRTEKNISQSEKREFAVKPIFLINECGIALPKELGSHKLQELGDSASVFIGDNGGLHAIKLNPVGVDQGDIIVNLSDYIVTKGNKEAKFSYGGGREYVFSYDSKSKHYKIVRTKTISF
jgi:hypothetical protein